VTTLPVLCQLRRVKPCRCPNPNVSLSLFFPPPKGPTPLGSQIFTSLSSPDYLGPVFFALYLLLPLRCRAQVFFSSYPCFSPGVGVEASAPSNHHLFSHSVSDRGVLSSSKIPMNPCSARRFPFPLHVGVLFSSMGTLFTHREIGMIGLFSCCSTFFFGLMNAPFPWHPLRLRFSS